MPNRQGVSLARFYYDQVLDALMRLKGELMPWHTDTDPYDAVNGILQAKGFVGHRDGVAIDRVGESFSWLAFATRPEAIALARLQGYRLKRDVPATVGVLGTLSARLAVQTTLVKLGALAATQRAADGSMVSFEHVGDDLVADPCDFVFKRRYWTGAAWAWATYTPGGALFSNPPVVDEAFYIGHPQLMFNKVSWAFATPNVMGTRLSAEYLDEGFLGTPQLVEVDPVLPGTLRFTVSTFLGVSGAVRRTGLTVTVRHRASGIETVSTMLSTDASRFTINSYLGQSIPSTNAADYEVETNWTPFRDGVSGTAGEFLTADGDSDFVLPVTTERKWVKATIDGVEGYWLRFRVAQTAGNPPPNANTVEEGTDGSNWFCYWEPVQGQTVTDELGESDGSVFQAFKLNYSPYIEDSLSDLQVGTDSDWSKLESLYYADGDTKAYAMEETTDEEVQVRTGNGVNGVIPPSGDTVRVAYRVGADLDGNVGVGTVTNMRSGISGLALITNPRAGYGWAAREGVDDIDIDRIRQLFPAKIRAGQRAVTAQDYETLAMGTFTYNGGSPVKRAVAQEEGGGPKTVLLVCSGVGGALLETAILDALGEYFNGQRIDLQRFGGVGLLNTECVPVNYQPQTVDVVAEVHFLKGYGVGKKGQIEQALRAVLAADANMATWKIATGREDEVVPADFASFLWNLGSEVQLMKLSGVVLQAAGSGILDIVGMTLNGVAANVALTDTRLPAAGTINITVVEV